MGAYIHVRAHQIALLLLLVPLVAAFSGWWSQALLAAFSDSSPLAKALCPAFGELLGQEDAAILVPHAWVSCPMSNSTSNTTTTGGQNATVEAYTNFVQENYFNISSRVLFLWDYCITFDDEVQYVWKGKWTPATFIFLINRYVNLVITILELFEQISFQTSQSCSPFVRLLQSLLVLALFIVAAFTALRVYAIWNRDWRPALPVLLLALVSPVVNIYMDATQEPEVAPSPSVGCAVYLKITNDLFGVLTIVTRASTLATDGIVLLLTIIRAIRLKKEGTRWTRKVGLLPLLLRDGVLYFLLLFCINLTQIIVTAQVAGNNDIVYYVSPVTSMLISRFLIDLRRVVHRDQSEQSGATSVCLTTNVPVPSTFTVCPGDLYSFGDPVGSGSSGFDSADELEKLYEPKVACEHSICNLPSGHSSSEVGQIA
ncbi:uncharacterized protein PHACADRAFT_254235 [Phanerochaete carnosa HHB-10118-sp]|uniref:DUF6533 domain-containing protein n=1 Tax=Phanerochaete carnosa (strain HHB-10118-sp) TaxID=650164 RepID=K5WCD0_PHACS|nr:uncharacterized protein PHACADRAFT_254235 [Phanerochaete carnosa HHB-10118-sp]EKM56875.1 hypothetical protein PHACADRAFT_254235 [Phanerochaete carnosa HHB-10118-sp]